MCFSAEASFVAAAVTAAAGAYAVARVPDRSFLLFASIPLVFAIQQVLEGFVWIGLDTGASTDLLNTLSKSFLLIGEAVWPLWIPLAVLAIEPDPMRRRVMSAAALIGGLMLAGFAAMILLADYSPTIQSGCICYQGRIGAPSGSGFYPFAPGQGWQISGLDWMLVPYAVTTIGTLLISSRNAVRGFGGVSGIGLIVSLLLYRHALISVWCFFAAAASIVVVWTIVAERRKTPATHATSGRRVWPPR
ncbi:MAG: DUF6629 family protein [Pseudomonadota bacterium]